MSSHSTSTHRLSADHSTQFFVDLLNAYPGAVIVVDDQDFPVYFSSTFQELFGDHHHGRIIETILKTLSSEKPLSGTISRRTPYRCDVQLETNLGCRPFSFDIVDFPGREGYRIIYLRKGEEAKNKHVRASTEIESQAFRYILKHDPNAIAVFDRSMNYIMVSDRFLMDYNVRKEDVIGKNHYAIFPDIPERWKEIHRQVLNGEIRRKLEDSFVRDDGSITYTNWECRPWYRQNGDIGGIVMYTEVITERKYAEMALRNSEHLLRQLMNSTAEAIVGLDQQGTCVFINQSGLEVLGFDSDEEIIGRDFHDLCHHSYPDGRPFPRSECRQLQALHEQRPLFIRTTTFWRKDGTSFPASYRMQPYYLDERFAGMVATFMDISEQIQAGEERKKLEEQLRQSQKMEAIGTLAGGIAHDFNNILGGIIGYGELVEVFELDDAAEIRGKVSKMLGGAYRAKELVSQILAFSRNVATDFTTVRIQSLIEEVLVILRASLPSTITIVTDFNVSSDTIYGDATGIHQVLLNLCTNAADAMKSGGGTLSLSLRELHSPNDKEAFGLPPDNDPWLELAVRDTGSGFKSEDSVRIFEPYYTTKEKGAGTGLGLALVYGIVKAHGGRIIASSTPGRGSLFRVFLLLQDRQDEEIALLIDDLQTVEPLHVLLVDDEEALVGYSSEMLSKMGHRVTAKRAGDVALESFCENPDDFDLVITDETMPGITGVELAKRIRSVRNDIPILLCTGNLSSLAQDEVTRAGIISVMEKPVRLKTFKEHIARAIRESRKERWGEF